MENQQNIPPIEPIQLGLIEAQLTDCEGLADDLEFGLKERMEYLDTPQKMAEMIRFCREQMEMQPKNIQVIQDQIILLQRILTTNPHMNDAIILLEHYIQCIERLRDNLEVAFQFLNV